MEFLRQEFWSGLPFSSPGDLPGPEMEPVSPALVGFFTTEPPGKPLYIYTYIHTHTHKTSLFIHLGRISLSNAMEPEGGS